MNTTQFQLPFEPSRSNCLVISSGPDWWGRGGSRRRELYDALEEQTDEVNGKVGRGVLVGAAKGLEMLFAVLRVLSLIYVYNGSE